jgi:hypothetical protein
LGGTIIIAVAIPFLINEYIEELILLTLNDLTTDPNESQYIRGIMIYFSVVLATKYFPFGTGAASYGTLLSDNSPVYREIGLSTTYHFQTKWGIYDSNFASILGEFGVLGMVLFAYILYKMFRLVVKNGATRSFAVVFAALISFYSLVTPTFMSSYSAMLLALLMVAAVPRQQDIDKVERQKAQKLARQNDPNIDCDANKGAVQTKVNELE